MITVNPWEKANVVPIAISRLLTYNIVLGDIEISKQRKIVLLLSLFKLNLIQFICIYV